MAEIIARPASPVRGPRRCARLSTRVDLTPMVDLGFLLITFFIFNTRLSQPMTIHLVMPANGDSTAIPASKTLNLVLEAENRVFYYPGAEVWNQNCTDFSPTGLRKLLLETQQNLRKHNRENGSLIVLIYPRPGSSYINLVDTIDELMITGVKNYVVMDSDWPAQTQLRIAPGPC